MDLFSRFYEYYYLVLILQGICVFHSIRRGTQSKWIWMIVFLPFIGCLAYLFTEIIQKQHFNTVQSGMSTLVNPHGRIKELEDRFRFSATFANRTALADAYFAKGQYDRAIELYEPALTGIFDENEAVIKSLMQAYYKVERFEDIVRLAPKVSNSLDFAKNPANLCYALALEQVGEFESAEKEFKRMNLRFSNYDARCSYGAFLVRIGRSDDAFQVYQNIIIEAQQLRGRERNSMKPWAAKAQQEMNKLAA